jgi:hypothetical protein
VVDFDHFSRACCLKLTHIPPMIFICCLSRDDNAPRVKELYLAAPPLAQIGVARLVKHG